MNLIDDSYISFVNLDHRTDRLIKMQANLNRLGLTAERTRGQYFEEFVGNRDHYRTMFQRKQKGAIGCFQSQLKVMKKALSLNKHALVFEDDLVFAEDFNKRIEYISNWSTTHNWAIIWLGGTFHIGKPYWDQKRKEEHRLGRDAELTDDPRMIKTYASFCTYSYLVNKSYIQKVIDLLEEYMPESWGIDHSMIMNVQQKVPTFAFVPGMVKQYDNVSDQIPEQPDNQTIFSGFAKLNGTIENSRYWWQDKMEDFDPLIFDWAEARTE